MKLQELLIMRGIDLEKTKLIRHNITNEDVSTNLSRGYLDIYQSIQRTNRFKGCEYVLSFLGTEGTNGKYLGCYKVVGCVPFEPDLLPRNFFVGKANSEDDVFWKLEKTDILADLEDRLVIEWGKSTLSWCQNGTTEKEILYILPTLSPFEFTGYDKIILTYDVLKSIVNNNKEHKIWEEKLSAVAGVYLITDTKTGKHYVGSASSSDNGIWGRWSSYAKTKHGGNKQLVALMDCDPNYCENFIFSILDIFPIKRDRSEVLEYEQRYKRKLCSIQFGLNDN